jgi:hypothetical protein
MLAELHRIVRALEESVGRPIGILVDLQGPKIRLGTLPGGMREVHKGDRLHLVRKVESDNADRHPDPACRGLRRDEARREHPDRRRQGAPQDRST